MSFMDDDQADNGGTVYPDSTAWLTGWLAPRYRRAWTNGNERVWCPGWQEHPEAVSRIDGMWRAWEKAEAKGDGLAAWWIGVADPMMDALTAEDGPFAKCGDGHRERLQPLPHRAVSGGGA